MRFLLSLLFFLCFLAYCIPLQDYRIALCPEATPAEQTAARELREHLLQSAGVDLPVVPYAPEMPGALFVIGPTQEGLRISGHSSLGELRRDQIVLKTSGERLHLFGARPRGTLYAVYEFLEESVGVIWLSAEATHIPSLPPAWEVPSWDYQYSPPFYVRAVSTAVNGNEPSFHSHMRGNGMYQPNDERFGGCRDVSFRIYVHSFEHLIPPKKYFQEHPEWFSYRRDPFQKAGRKANAQLCLTNQEMRRELVKNALDFLRQDSNVGFLSVSQNDNVRFCQCDACQKRVEKLGSLTDLYLDLVNQVAEAVEQEFPHVMVETLAYRFTRHPPKTIRPRDNVAIRLCTIEAASFQTLETPGPNSALREDFLGWAPLAKQLMVWDYTTVFRKFWQPHPNWDTLAKNLRFFQACGGISIFEQNGSGGGGGKAADLPELRNWVLCKLTWNPSLDTWSLVEKFIRPYYGPGRAFVWKYLRETTALAKGSDNCYTATTRGWLPEQVLRELWLEGEVLFQLYKGDPVYGSRIMAATLPLAMSAMERGFAPPAPWNYAEYADELVRRLESLGVRTLSEHASAPGHTPEIWRNSLPKAPLE